MAQTTAAAAGSARLPVAYDRTADISEFYRARGGRLLWLTPQSGEAARRMIGLLNGAAIDRLDPRRYQVDRIVTALRAASSGNPRALSTADTLLSQAFVNYVRDLRREPNVGIVYVDRDLVPTRPSAREVLARAATAPSLEAYVDTMAWMNPAYVQLRRALLLSQGNPDERARLAVNLERAAALPTGNQRYVIVNIAAQRLSMIENNAVVDTMRVVVGKTKYPTPMMSAWIRAAALNPSWNVPPDLAAERIAPNVVKQGLGYLKTLGYEVLSDWTDHATVIDPATVDWPAVADRRVEVRIRQQPGPHNSLGKMKFVFPNAQGIFLHDTPERELLSEASRLYSGGCIRLEDAQRLGRWMFGHDLEKSGDAPEQIVAIPEKIPLYVTYLTAVPDSNGISYFDDVYGRDAARVAALGGGIVASR
ncbi:MAG: L,D-transpeptidase family protein [Sphingomicrobium sp.]